MKHEVDAPQTRTRLMKHCKIIFFNDTIIYFKTLLVNVLCCCSYYNHNTHDKILVFVHFQNFPSNSLAKAVQSTEIMNCDIHCTLIMINKSQFPCYAFIFYSICLQIQSGFQSNSFAMGRKDERAAILTTKSSLRTDSFSNFKLGLCQKRMIEKKKLLARKVNESGLVFPRQVFNLIWKTTESFNRRAIKS